MSRRPRRESQFGSDSFLDVVANIVGILIILIVVAGVRVSQAPLHPTPSASDPAAEQLVASASASDDSLDEPLEPLLAPEEAVANPAPLAPPPQIAAQPKSEPLELPAAIMEQADAIAREIERMQSDYRAAAEQTGTLRQTEADWHERLARLREQIATREKESKTLADELETRRTSFEQLQATAESLLKQIDEEVRKTPPVETLEHRVTPVSKVVTGHEQHYRLLGNRVSEVPIAALSNRLREQIERRKDWLIKQRSHQGTVGPIGGYTMHYVVQRDNLGVLDEIRYGQGMIRISVSQWQIEPDASLLTESAAEALRPGSRFADSLVNADEKTSLTFWVYPDSYQLYRRLQQFAHEQGYLVAGRPLPFGIPISGSPNGSKSAGQ